MSHSDNEQYNKISRQFSQLVDIDPSRQYVQFPTILRLLGKIKDKDILEIGCGEGALTRQLAENGANVIAYDSSVEQIKIAEEKTDANQGIRYFVADNINFQSDILFDAIVSNMVLPYIENEQKLEILFKDVYYYLKDDGIFISIIANPDFKRFGSIIYNRRWTQDSGGKINVEFFNNNKEFQTSAMFNNLFSKGDYEKYADKAYFSNVMWADLKIEKEGIKVMGKEFWKGYNEDCPYIVLILKK